MKNMQPEIKCEEMFYGSVTVGDRGQVVIPAEARGDLGFQPGDKLLAMRHPIHNGIMFFKLDEARRFLDHMARELERIQSSTPQGNETNPDLHTEDAR